jgi:hypothetical protein
MQAFNIGAVAQRDGWIDASWEKGSADPLNLVELRTRADAYRAVTESTYDDLAKFGGDE